jgi:hypothetical protein
LEGEENIEGEENLEGENEVVIAEGSTLSITQSSII